MPEEIGKPFHGECVMDADLVDFELFDYIVITPIGYDSDILPKFITCKMEKISGLDIVNTDTKIILKSKK